MSFESEPPSSVLFSSTYPQSSLELDNNYLDLSPEEYDYFYSLIYSPFFEYFPVSKKTEKLKNVISLQSYFLNKYGNYLIAYFWQFYYDNKEHYKYRDLFSRLFSFVKNKRQLYLILSQNRDLTVEELWNKEREALLENINLPKIKEKSSSLIKFLDSLGSIFLK
jgi:hypothetical protein